MRTTTTILLSFLFLAAGALVLTFMAEEGEAATITVKESGGADYEKIQEAIDAADEGDTIMVLEGWYPEIVVDKTLTIIGSGWRTTMIQGYNENTITINANWCNISGFRIDLGGDMYWKNVLIQGNHTTIRHNKITNWEQNGYGVYAWCYDGWTYENVTVENNIFVWSQYGIYLRDASNSIIRNNSFDSSKITAISLAWGENLRIEDNTCMYGGTQAFYSSYITDLIIRNNVFSRGSGAGMGLYGCDFVQIEDNRIEKNSNGHYGVSLSNNNHTLFQRNRVSGSWKGIYFTTSWELEGNIIRENDISGNEVYGIEYKDSSGVTLEAEGNWWGSSTGPNHTNNPGGEGDAISGDMKFGDWLQERATEEKIWTFYVDKDGDDVAPDGLVTNPFNNIKDAISKARDSDTIRVYAGSYRENVNLGKTLSLIGNGSESTTIVGDRSNSVVRLQDSRCVVQGFNLSNGLSGIYFDTSGNEIRNNIFYGNKDSGISIRGGSDNLVVDNVIRECGGSGIYIYSTSSATIRNNQILESGEDGLWSRELISTTFSGNTISGAVRYSIYTTFSSRSIFSGNDIRDPGEYGFRIHRSTTLRVLENTLVGCGISLDGEEREYWTTHTIDATNTVNGKAVHYLCNATGGEVPAGVGQVILGNCSGVTVSDQTLDDVDYGLILAFSKNNTITSCSMDDCLRAGIWLFNSQDNWLISNTVLNCLENGIKLLDSNGNNFSGNIVEESGGRGLKLYNSKENSFRDNTITHNEGEGVFCEMLCEENRFLNNTISDNNGTGIYLWKSTFNVMDGNTVKRNSEDGIFIHFFSDSNQLSGNRIEENGLNGVHFSFSSGMSELFNNTVTGNGKHGFYLEADRDSVGNSGNNHFSGNGISGNQGCGILLSGWKTYSTGVASNTLENNSITGNEEHGIHLFHSDSNTLSGNLINGNGGCGLRFDGSCWNKLSLNTVNSNAEDGLFFIDSNENKVRNGTINDNTGCGVAIINVDFEFDDQTVFSGNTISSNGKDGMNITNLTVSANFLISHNEITGNDNHGVSVWDSFRCTVKFNTISDSRHGIHFSELLHADVNNNTIEGNEIGIYLSGTDDKATAGIDHNNIVGNSKAGLDSGDFQSSTGATKNWWGSPTGPYFEGNNEEGTGDKIIDGSANWYWAIVYYKPWLVRPADYFSPEAIILSQGPNTTILSRAHRFTGEARTYASALLYVWNSSIDGELHNASTANFSTAGLSLGEHLITLRIKDDYEVWGETTNFSLLVHLRPEANIDFVSSKSTLVNETVTFRALGVDDGSIVRYIWTSSIDGEFYNGTEAEIEITALSAGKHDIFLMVQDDNGAWSSTDGTTLEVKSSEDDDTFILFQEFGPLPLIAYLGLVLGLILVVVVVVKRKAAGKKEETPLQGQAPTTPFTPAPQVPLPQPAPPQQMPQYPTPQQQYQQYPQPGQQQTPQTTEQGWGAQQYSPQQATGQAQTPYQAPQPVPLPAAPAVPSTTQVPSQVKCPSCGTIIQVNPANRTPEGKVRIACPGCGVTGSI